MAGQKTSEKPKSAGNQPDLSSWARRKFGLGLCLGPDPAMNIEPRVLPGEKAFGPFRGDELLADQKGKNLPSEEFSQP